MALRRHHDPLRKSSWIRRRACSSSLTSFSDDGSFTQSDESAIFNAARISDDGGDYHQAHLATANESLLIDEADTNNILLPDDAAVPWNDPRFPKDGCRRRRRKARLHSDLLAHSLSADDEVQLLGSRSMELGGFDDQLRRTVSFMNREEYYYDHESASPTTTTPTTTSTYLRAIQPLLPSYPPLTKSPTPPGLPSFGTLEAKALASQFLVRPSQHDLRARRKHDDRQLLLLQLQDGHASGRGQVRGRRRRRLLQRLFGSRLHVAPLANEVAVRGIGRADDGTVVQGYFPHRNTTTSGYGIVDVNHGRRQRIGPLKNTGRSRL